MYFGILVDYVGGFWVQGLVENEIRLIQGGTGKSFEEIFIIVDPSTNVNTIRKEYKSRMHIYRR